MEPQVNRSVSFEEPFVRLLSRSSPSAPPSSADDGIQDRLIVVLLFSVRFDVTLAMDLNNDMPSVPPSGTKVLLWDKSVNVISMINNNINRLIPVPMNSFVPLFKNAMIQRNVTFNNLTFF